MIQHSTHRISFLLLLMVILLGHVPSTYAQYANGSGTGRLQKEIYWLTWGSALASKPADMTSTKITAGTYSWNITPTARVRAVISNITGSTGNLGTTTLAPYSSGTFPNDGLQKLYPGVNPLGLSTRLADSSDSLTVDGGTVTFDIEVSLDLLINGVWTTVPYPGLVLGDAESLSFNGIEYIQGTSNSALQWQLLDLRNEAQPDLQPTYQLAISDAGKAFKLDLSSSTGNIWMQAVLFARNATKLTHVQLKGQGITALAFGFIAPFDFGDAPATYGNAGHYINNFTFDFPSISADGTYPIINIPKATPTPAATVYLGANNTDAEQNAPNSTDANADDNTGSDDEDGLVGDFPTINSNSPDDVSLKIRATNTQSSPATLYTWIDFNRDGVFSANEAQTITVPANTTDQLYTLTYPNSSFSSVIQAGASYARFRITTSSLTDDPSTAADERSFSVAGDGEAEDYSLVLQGMNLPVRLVDFGVRAEGQIAQLNWTTTEEQNSDRFEIEHSLNLKDWRRVGTVAAQGESNSLQTYTFYDADPANGANYYRLKMIDSDRSFEYSKTRSINFDIAVQTVLFPNPALDKAALAVDDWSKVDRIQLIDAIGKIRYDQQRSATETLSGDLNLSGLPLGVYVVRLTRTNGTVTSLKLIKR